jgi:hypothetical protein
MHLTHPVSGAVQVYEQLAVRLEQQDAEEGAPATDEYTRLTPELGSLLWCQYMRFLRRAETVMEARKVGGEGGDVLPGGEMCCHDV